MKKCISCKREFQRPKCYSTIQWEKRKYCTFECARLSFSKTRFKQWKNPVYVKMMSEAHMGQRPWNKGKEVPQIQSEKHVGWKGDSATYVNKHTWVRRRKVLPKRCEICKKLRKLEWSNKDHKYKRNLLDYQAICRFCHRQYDKKLNEKNSKVSR